MDTSKFTIKVKSPKIPRKLKKKLKKEGKYKRRTTIFKNCEIGLSNFSIGLNGMLTQNYTITFSNQERE